MADTSVSWKAGTKVIQMDVQTAAWTVVLRVILMVAYLAMKMGVSMVEATVD